MLDRVMLACSVAELSFLGCTQGFHCFTLFQWGMIALIAAKVTIVVAKLCKRLGDWIKKQSPKEVIL